MSDESRVAFSVIKGFLAWCEYLSDKNESAIPQDHSRARETSSGNVEIHLFDL